MKNKIKVLGLVLFFLGGVLCGVIFNKKNNQAKVTYLNENIYYKKELVETFEKNKKNELEKMVAIVTSHHLLAKDLIAEAFSKIDNKKIERVIVVSPDHFKQIKNSNCMIMTANIGWKAKDEMVLPDSKTITNFLSQPNWCENINIFRGEHGVSVLIPFIRNYLPKTKIIPLVLRQNNNLSFFYKLGEDFKNTFDKEKTLVIVSSDFCHNISKNVAKSNDLTSIKILESKDNDKIGLINNDCPQCIAFLFGYLGRESNFEFIRNTNSYEISGEYPESVTSYISGYY